MLHDEQFYPDAYTFNPDRHIMTGPDGKMKINPDVMPPENIVFGFGRRECPGQHMAYASVWMTVVSILSAFRIEKRVNPDGTINEPTYEYGTLLGLYVLSLSFILVILLLTFHHSIPEPFECHFEPRFEGVVQLINNTEDI